MLDPKLTDEPARMAALERYDVLDTPREPSFDRITDLVRSILGLPISATSLVDAGRQGFNSRAVLDAGEPSRNTAFCAQTIGQRRPIDRQGAVWGKRVSVGVDMVVRGTFKKKIN